MASEINLGVLYNTFLYHGTTKLFDNPSLDKAKPRTDFGAAFYCTSMTDQAARWVLRKGKGFVNFYRFMVPSYPLRTITFAGYTLEWLDFIAHCRRGELHNYDIVEGPVADDKVYNYVTDFIDGIITAEQFMSFASYNKPSHQVAFCTPKALQCLKFINRRTVQ